MKNPLNPLFLILFISIIYPANLSRAESNNSTLVSSETPNTLFHLNETSTATSYNLLLRTSSRIKPEIRKTTNGYELIFRGKSISNIDPFIGITNKKLGSSSNFVREIAIIRSPGQVNMRIISDNLTEPRISISEDKLQFLPRLMI